MLNQHEVFAHQINFPDVIIGSSGTNNKSCFETAIKYGFRAFDTAYMYKSESDLGEAVEECIQEGIIKREDLFIQSKAPHLKAGYQVTLDEFENSLKRLKMDYLDSYLIHYPQRDKNNWQELIIDTWRALEVLYKMKKVKMIGVSNFLPHHLEFLIKNAEIKPMINQIEVHPEHRQEILQEYCKNNDIWIQAWGATGCGRSFYNNNIKEIANKHHTTILNIVLNWHKKMGVVPIVGIDRETMLQEIKNFSSVEFDVEDITILSSLKENFTGCHTEGMFQYWSYATPHLHPVQPVDPFTPYEKTFYLFNFLPFFKIIKERGNKTKVYLFNLPLCETKTTVFKNKKTKWEKSDYISGKYKIEPVFNNRNRFLECPVWDSKNNVVYCIASANNEIYKIDPDTNEFCVISTTKGPIGCIDICPDGSLVVAEDTGIYKLNLKDNKRTFIIQIKPDAKYAFDQVRCSYNDGKLDAKGRFIVGTASSYNSNKLYSFDGNEVKVLEHNITVSNGIAWSKDNTKMFYTDTATQKVGVYKYDLETGNAIFERYVIDFKSSSPDGMCIDIDDNLWVAEFHGKKVSKWDTKTFEKIDEINFPVNVTSCCIGGIYIYITTCKEDSEKDSGLYRVKIR